MFDAIKNFVADLASGGKQAGGLADHDFRVATAALLVHAATVDGDMSTNDTVIIMASGAAVSADRTPR